MGLLRLRLLGGLSAERTADGSPVSIQPRRLAALALIAEARDRGISRANVQALLWPDADEESGRRVLNQAVYALKRDAESDELFLDTRELRLNPAIVTVDLWDFEAALTAGNHEHAAAAYGGPFLDGFRLPQAPEVERWIDERRSALEHRYGGVLERLAQMCREKGDSRGAVMWWRKLAGLTPLSGRVALELMRDMAAMGDREGALQHARIYESLVASELELPADPAVVQFAESLRRANATPIAIATPVRRVEAMAEVVVAPVLPDESTVPVEVPLADIPAAVGGGRRRRQLLVAAGLVLVVGIMLGAWVTRRGTAGSASANDGPLLAVGEVSVYRDAGDSTLARPLADMLATNLARAPAVRVLSAVRMVELMRQLGAADAASAGLVAAAARQAGAAQLVDGALFRLTNGSLRLDLRRIDLRDGKVIAAYTVNGTDVFSLADSATALLARDVGGGPPRGSISDVTTRSIIAYGLFEQGLRAFASGEDRRAESLFESALAADSSFAMAAYYYGLSGLPEETIPRLARAARLADAAPHRERLILRTGLAFRNSDPLALAYADTLTMQYPEEIEGHLYRGLALLNRGENAAALPSLRRVIVMDSLALRGTRARCAACEALESLVFAYIAMDSSAMAVREARRWTELQPNAVLPWASLRGALAASGHRGDEVRDAVRMMATIDPLYDREPSGVAYRWLPVDDPAAADSALRQILADGTPVHRVNAHWYLSLALREQGRYAEALDEARRYRNANPSRRNAEAAFPTAQALHDLGQHLAAAALFDSVARWRVPDESPTRHARGRAWAMTLAGTSLAAAGDTAGLAARADSVRVLGERSSLCRDPLLHHYLRGLLLQARGDHAGAVENFRQAICTTTLGYTRMNHAMARSLLALGRAREAVAILQPALRGSIEGSNFYLTRAEVHELLAEAWDRLEQRDSASAHYAIVARVWAGADTALQPRLTRVKRRLEALGTVQRMATPR